MMENGETSENKTRSFDRIEEYYYNYARIFISGNLFIENKS